MTVFAPSLNFVVKASSLKKLGCEVKKKAVAGFFVHEVSKNDKILFVVPFRTNTKLSGNFSKQPEEVKALLREAGAVLSPA